MKGLFFGGITGVRINARRRRIAVIYTVSVV